MNYSTWKLFKLKAESKRRRLETRGLAPKLTAALQEDDRNHRVNARTLVPIDFKAVIRDPNIYLAFETFEMQEYLHERGLGTTGSSLQLIERLLDYDKYLFSALVESKADDPDRGKRDALILEEYDFTTKLAEVKLAAHQAWHKAALDAATEVEVSEKKEALAKKTAARRALVNQGKEEERQRRKQYWAAQNASVASEKNTSESEANPSLEAASDPYTTTKDNGDTLTITTTIMGSDDEASQETYEIKKPVKRKSAPSVSQPAKKAKITEWTDAALANIVDEEADLVVTKARSIIDSMPRDYNGPYRPYLHISPEQCSVRGDKLTYMRKTIFKTRQGLCYVYADVDNGYYIVYNAGPRGEEIAEHCYKHFNGSVMFGKKVELTLVSGQERWDRARGLKKSNTYPKSSQKPKIPELPEGSGLSDSPLQPIVDGHNYIFLFAKSNGRRPKYLSDIQALWAKVWTKSPTWIQLDDTGYYLRYEDSEQGDKAMDETVNESLAEGWRVFKQKNFEIHKRNDQS